MTSRSCWSISAAVHFGDSALKFAGQSKHIISLARYMRVMSAWEKASLTPDSSKYGFRGKGPELAVSVADEENI
jgi:hypothetical protein